jgi:soluble lytic murein transglycosylase
MKKFDRRVPLVAAAYNAGPHRVDNWLSNFGSLDMDEFIEHIPFLETRNYVKGVLSNYEAYSKIYALNGPRLTYLTDTCGISVRQELATRESWGEIE